MSGSRLDALLAMHERNPADSRVLFALAIEYEKLQQHEDVARVLQTYLETSDDQGNAWGRLAQALVVLGRTDEARTALQRGIEAATRHGHPTMAAEFGERLDEIE